MSIWKSARQPKSARSAGFAAVLSLFCAIGLVTLTARDAHAATTTSPDNFESGTGWSYGSTQPTYSNGYISTWASARSGTHVGLTSFASGATTSDWLQFYKVFTTAVTPTACSATIYLNGWYYGGHGSVDMIDSATWSYIGTKAFTIAGNSTWVPITVTNTWACTKSIALRVVLDANPSAQSWAYEDDASVTWTF